MNDKTVHCEDSHLEILLSGEETSDLFIESSAHVESCTRCQLRLTKLAGPEETWQQVGELLAGVSEIENSAEFVGKAPDYLDTLEGILDPPAQPDLLGRLGRYEIERVIGSGGMGIVLRGFDTELNRPVAIKILARHLAHSGAARQRFARESRAAAAVVHEHVVAIHNVETGGKTPYLVMQYVAGESLQSRVDQGGPLDPKEVLRIGIQAAAGLHAAHEQGVIHRDIKPANILLEHGVDRALVTDFGLARTVDDATLTQTGIIAGTPHYMSPEQATGELTDERTDLFSLGSLLYFMAAARPPFRADHALGVLNRICHEPHKPLWRVNSEVPDELSEIVDRLLEKKPKRRFGSAVEAQGALTHCLARLQQRGPRRHAKVVRFWRRNRKVVSMVALVLAAATGVLMFSTASHDGKAASKHSAVSGSVAALIAKTDPPEFSLETWQMASEGEQRLWEQSLQEVDRALAGLEADSVRPEAGSAKEWNAQIEGLHSQLNLLQDDEISAPQSSH